MFHFTSFWYLFYPSLYVDLEDGHTLHLVARQPTEGQSSSGTGPEGTAQNNNNQGVFQGYGAWRPLLACY